jgi:hypothetical protein
MINQAIDSAAISKPLPEQLWPLVMPGSCSTSIALAYFVRCRQELKSPRFYSMLGAFIPTYGTLQLHAGSCLPAGPHISMPRHSNPAFQNKAKFNLIH